MTRRDLVQLGLLAPLALDGTSRLCSQPAAKSGPAVPSSNLDSPLYLPTTGGAATRVKFANAPDWARDTPGWYVPNVVSAGSGLLQFVPKREYQLSSLVKNFRDLSTLVS